MSKLDPFARAIVSAVRRMPDEAILALVQTQLEAVMGQGAPARRSAGRSGRGAPRPRRQAGQRGRPRANTERLAQQVERIVRSSKGMSLADVAGAVGEAKTRVAPILRDLKFSRRIFQGGDRRFARYAGDPKTAAEASRRARGR